jgi:hypothetical protein
MVQISFPTISGIVVTVNSDDIASLEAGGAWTFVTMNDASFYRSPAPIELFELTIANGGGPVLLEPLPPTADQLGAPAPPADDG